MFKSFRKIISLFALVTFITQSVGLSTVSAQQVIAIQQVAFSQPGLSEGFNPMVLRGIKVDLKDPFRLDFIVDSGDDKIESAALKSQSEKLIKYFFAALTTPEDDLWVNLSPYEKDRIIPAQFGTTEMGRDLLVQDNFLKQYAASLVNPDTQLGKKYWDEINKKTTDAGHSTLEKTNVQPPVSSVFAKVWIVPDTAVVYQNAGSAYVGEAHLKVMMQEDYLAAEKTRGAGRSTLEKTTTNVQPLASNVSTEVFRRIILPVIEKEVNEGKHFSGLRQAYHSLILATWYKKTLKQSILSQVYVDKNKVAGIDILDTQAKEKIYEQYLKTFKDGVCNLVREEEDEKSGEMVPRKYFSGGILGKAVASASVYQPLEGNESRAASAVKGSLAVVEINAQGVNKVDDAESLVLKAQSFSKIQKASSGLFEARIDGETLRVINESLTGLSQQEDDKVSEIFRLVFDFIQPVPGRPQGRPSPRQILADIINHRMRFLRIKDEEARKVFISTLQQAGAMDPTLSNFTGAVLHERGDDGSLIYNVIISNNALDETQDRGRPIAFVSMIFHELVGHILAAELEGIPATVEEDEIRAYRLNLAFLEQVAQYADAMKRKYSQAQPNGPAANDFLLAALDSSQVPQKINEVRQMLEYYQKRLAQKRASPKTSSAVTEQEVTVTVAGEDIPAVLSQISDNNPLSEEELFRMPSVGIKNEQIVARSRETDAVSYVLRAKDDQRLLGYIVAIPETKKFEDGDPKNLFIFASAALPASHGTFSRLMFKLISNARKTGFANISAFLEREGLNSGVHELLKARGTIQKFVVDKDQLRYVMLMKQLGRPHTPGEVEKMQQAMDEEIARVNEGLQKDRPFWFGRIQALLAKNPNSALHIKIPVSPASSAVKSDDAKFEDFEALREFFHERKGEFKEGWWLGFDMDKASQLSPEFRQDIIRELNALVLTTFGYDGTRFFTTYKTDQSEEKEEGYLYLPKTIPSEILKYRLDQIREDFYEFTDQTVSFGVMKADDLEAAAQKDLSSKDPHEVMLINRPFWNLRVLESTMDQLLRQAKGRKGLSRTPDYGDKVVFYTPAEISSTASSALRDEGLESTYDREMINKLAAQRRDSTLPAVWPQIVKTDFMPPHLFSRYAVPRLQSGFADLRNYWKAAGLEQDFGSLAYIVPFQVSQETVSFDSLQRKQRMILEFLKMEKAEDQMFGLAQVALNHITHLRRSWLHVDWDIERQRNVFTDQELFMNEALPLYLAKFLDVLGEEQRHPWLNAVIPGPDGKANGKGITLKDYLLWVLAVAVDPSLHAYWNKSPMPEDISMTMQAAYGTTDQEQVMRLALERFFSHPLLSGRQKEAAQLVKLAVGINDAAWNAKGLVSPRKFGIDQTNLMLVVDAPGFLEDQYWTTYPLDFRNLRNRMMAFAFTTENQPAYPLDGHETLRSITNPPWSDALNYGLINLGLHHNNYNLKPVYDRILLPILDKVILAPAAKVDALEQRVLEQLNISESKLDRSVLEINGQTFKVTQYKNNDQEVVPFLRVGEFLILNDQIQAKLSKDLPTDPQVIRLNSDLFPKEYVGAEYQNVYLGINYNPGRSFSGFTIGVLAAMQAHRDQIVGNDFADFGAGFSGVLSIVAQRLGASKVHVVEAKREVLPQLEYNLRANGMTSDNYVLVNRYIQEAEIKSERPLVGAINLPRYGADDGAIKMAVADHPNLRMLFVSGGEAFDAGRVRDFFDPVIAESSGRRAAALTEIAVKKEDAPTDRYVTFVADFDLASSAINTIASITAKTWIASDVQKYIETNLNSGRPLAFVEMKASPKVRSQKEAKTRVEEALKGYEDDQYVAIMIKKRTAPGVETFRLLIDQRKRFMEEESLEVLTGYLPDEDDFYTRPQILYWEEYSVFLKERAVYGYHFQNRVPGLGFFALNQSARNLKKYFPGYYYIDLPIDENTYINTWLDQEMKKGINLQYPGFERLSEEYYQLLLETVEDVEDYADEDALNHYVIAKIASDSSSSAARPDTELSSRFDEITAGREWVSKKLAERMEEVFNKGRPLEYVDFTVSGNSETFMSEQTAFLKRLARFADDQLIAVLVKVRIKDAEIYQTVIDRKSALITEGNLRSLLDVTKARAKIGDFLFTNSFWVFPKEKVVYSSLVSLDRDVRLRGYGLFTLWETGRSFKKYYPGYYLIDFPIQESVRVWLKRNFLPSGIQKFSDKHAGLVKRTVGQIALQKLPYTDVFEVMRIPPVSSSAVEQIKLDLPSMIGPKLKAAMKELNGGKDLPIIVESGLYNETAERLEKKLEALPENEMVFVALSNYVPPGSKGMLFPEAIEYTIVADRRDQILFKLGSLERGSLALGEFEVLVNFKIYPEDRQVYLAYLSLGKDKPLQRRLDETQTTAILQGRGLASEIHTLRADALEQHYRGWQVLGYSYEEQQAGVSDQNRIPQLLQRLYGARARGDHNYVGIVGNRLQIASSQVEMNDEFEKGSSSAVSARGILTASSAAGEASQKAGSAAQDINASSGVEDFPEGNLAVNDTATRPMTRRDFLKTAAAVAITGLTVPEDAYSQFPAQGQQRSEKLPEALGKELFSKLKTLSNEEVNKFLIVSDLIMLGLSPQAKERLMELKTGTVAQPPRLNLLKITTADRPRVLQILQQAGVADRNDSDFSAAVLSVQFSNLRPKYNLIVGESVLNDPTFYVKTIAHELYGHILLDDLHGKLETFEDSELRAYEADIKFMSWLLKNIELIRKMIQNPATNYSPTVKKFLLDALDSNRIKTLISESNEAVARYKLRKMIKPRASSGVDNPGGINFNPNQLDMDLRGEAGSFELPTDPAQLQNFQFDGLLPVIINVVPIPSLPAYWGLSKENEGGSLYAERGT